MNYKWFRISYLLISGLLVVSCSETPIDKQYLNSPAYTQFSKKQQDEYSIKIDNDRSLRNYLAALGECEMINNRHFPLQVNSSLLQKIDRECSEVKGTFDINFETKVVGYSRFNSIILRWLLMKKNETIYQDWQFLTATYKDGKLLDFQVLGTFRKNLSQDISTEININESDSTINIVSFSNRAIRYPFEQENVFKSVFQINTQGRIQHLPSKSERFRTLPKYLEAFHQCPKAQKIPLPVQRENDFLKNAGKPCEQIKEIYGTKILSRNIGYTPFKDLTIRWISMVRKSTSEERKLVVAVYRGNALQSFERLGVFRKGESKDIITKIEASRNDGYLAVTSFQKRIVKSPIRHKNIIQSEFRITANGQIKKGQR